MAKINLDATAVESREQRLGTIVYWGGDALNLSEASGYSKGKKGCGGSRGGAGCRLCETKGPFTQPSVCSEQMVECQAGNIREAVLIQHAPIGCSASQTIYNSIYRTGLVSRGHKVENLRIYSTNLTEGDMVFGGVDKLKLTIEDVWDHYQPKAIFIGTSCPTGIIGDDVDSVAEEYTEKLGIPVIPLHCEGFRSKHWATGFDATQHGILRQIVTKNPTKKQEDLVNVINLWGSDVFGPMFAPLNLRVNYVVDLATVDELAQMSEAAATVAFCNTLGTYLAEGLEQAFGIPQVRAPQPYGILGTDAWLRDLARITHREHLVEDYIASEHARIAPEVEKLKEKLKGLQGFVSTGSAYAHGLIVVLRELGVTVNGSLVFHHDPIYDSEDTSQDSLAHLIDNYGNVEDFTVSIRQPFQFYTALKKHKPDFILIRHNGLAPLAARLGIPAAPLGDEHLAIGYNGLVNLGNLILEILERKRFCEDLSKHTELQYTKWWQDQTDPNILAKKPELIWEGEQ
jgi:nitrogenase molybdenum-iron protein alpha chain